MSRSNSQLNSNLAEKTSSAASFPVELGNETPSIDSTRKQDSFKSPFFNFMRDFKQNHKNKQYQYVMRLGGRRWRAMTQADRAPYVIEAARNRRTAKPKTRVDKKRQNSSANEKKSDNKRCPACGHRKTSRERSHSCSGSSGSSQSGSSRSRSSKSSNHSKK